MPKRKKNIVINYKYIIKTPWKKNNKKPLKLELTSCNKKVTLQWENRVKWLIKIALKQNKMLKIKLNVLGLQV